MPWVRLHGVKDYLDMVKILENYPAIRQTFNLVPSLIEQLDDYVNRTVKDKFLELSYKPADALTKEDKAFLLNNFFKINVEGVISFFPRYYELYFKKEAKRDFTPQDYLDLQLWFNLAWIDPCFRQNIPELKALVEKARFFSEEDKQIVLEKQIEILEDIIPTYKKFQETGQIEVIVSPYYHPILPLLYNTKIAKEASPKVTLPRVNFSHPEDAYSQIKEAVESYQSHFSTAPCGMWPSEQSVSEHIVPLLIEAGIKWIVADEAILFKSLKLKKRNTRLLYQPHLLKIKDRDLQIVFRDRNLSDLIGFDYHQRKTEDAVSDFLKHLADINNAFKGKDILVTVAMDGENAWEYFRNDGHDFLELLYQKISDSAFIKTTTVKEYLAHHPPVNQIKRLATGSWIFANFSKWIGSPYKNLAWEYLAKARLELDDPKLQLPEEKLALAYKQIYIAEGSDWFWWYGDDYGDFDILFRTHLSNFYTIIGKEVPSYLESPLVAN